LRYCNLDEPTIPDDIYDVTIIGGGPVGQYAAYYSGLRGMTTKIIDSLPELGGQLTALYPEKYIFDVAGFTKVYAKDLVHMLTEQMMQYDLSVCLDEKVTELESGEEYVRLASANGQVHFSRTVIISAGRGAFTPRKLDLQRLDDLEGRGVHYFVGDKSILKGKRLLIVGGGDSAFDWALNLHDTAESITMIHRTDQFRAHEDTVVRVLELGVVMNTFHEMKALHGDEHVDGATIYNNKTMEEQRIECDDILLTLGFLANLGPIKEWGLELQGNYIKVNTKMETNIPRVYAAGDGIVYDGKLPLISTGFGDAATAVNHAYVLLHPGKKSFVHSSEQSK
jgi:ferredoxin/flavodoxin---NADP+ reductase